MDNDAVVSGRFKRNTPGSSKIAVAKLLWIGGWGFAAHLPAGASKSGKAGQGPGKKR
jgi:hypothetical protein